MRGTSRTRGMPLGRWLPRLLTFSLLALALGVQAIVYNESLDPWNLNKNKDATDSIDFRTNKRGNYTKSPENWRALPTYTLLADKWIDGDPTNNDFFGLIYEYDWRETQLRTGGDIAGLMDPRGLDYIQSLGYRSIYIAGTPFINMPWQADGYSAIDFGLLDPHFGTLEEWSKWVDEVHRRGMYVIFDFTVGTMGDLIGFKGHLNSSTPFNTNEYEVQWKLPDYAPWGLNKYPDFNFTNDYNESCQYPTFWDESGVILDMGMQGCYASTFDHYGDVEAFGVFPDWMRQLAKFASVQDRLREWRPDVMDRLTVFSCMCIEALDIDGIRIDKAIQVTVDALAKWSGSTRECARKLGKENFFIPGEITGGDTFGSIYIGRGRTPQMRSSVDEALNLTHDDESKFIRDRYKAPVDAAAFHYSLYRSMLRWLGLDGMLSAGYDVPVNFVDAWNTMLINNDFLNQMTGEFDPRHMWGVTNQDVLRWPIMAQGVERQLVGSFITHLVMPGMPKAWYGEEQELYILDSSAANYLYGRQSMVATGAWKRHGCYRLGAGQYFNLPYDRVLMGCLDDKVALDHLDPTAPIRRTFRNMNYVRSQFPGVQDGFMLSHLSNHTHLVQYPGSQGTPTETGLWSSHRGPSPKQMAAGGVWNHDGDLSQGVWLMYTNLNVSKTYEVDCQKDPILGPFPPDTRVKNLLFPFDEHVLTNSSSPLVNRGCVDKLDMEPFDFKAYVPISNWIPMLPSVSGFTPGHDARVVKNGDTVDIEIEWDQEMDCDSVNAALSDSNALKFVGEPGASPKLVSRGQYSGCQTIENPVAHDFVSATVSRWKWTGQIQGAAEGMYHIQIRPVAAQGGNRTTEVTDHLLFRVGNEDNTFVFPDHDYDNSILSVDGDSYTLKHKAWGADRFRYSADFGKHWTTWTDMEAETSLNATAFKDNWWKGDHLMVQYYSAIAGTAAQVAHADHNYDGHERRYPQMMLRGKFNGWGYDLGMDSHLEQKDHGDWAIPIGGAWPSQFQLNIWAFDDYFYGDADGDGVLDRLPPNALTPNFMNVSAPPRPHLAWQIGVNDRTGRWTLTPIGHESSSIIVFALLLIIPIITALAAAAIFRYSFYQIKINKWGQKPAKETSYFPIVGAAVHHDKKDKKDGAISEKHGAGAVVHHSEKLKPLDHPIGWPEVPSKRRKVLIATLEYEIFDWQLKVKIGGLGVMSGLMGKAMTDVDLIWIIPKVQDLDYPMGEYAEPIEVTIFGEPYLIEVETHELDNITYVLLDSPVFRAQTKSDPYPQRMDDLSSAIFYSTWNQAIAETIRRFPDIDIYHINDYHGALAPLYLLPQIMPVCLSLHNAEFQGLWPLRTKEEMKEVCAAFNISKDICSKYVQFGNTFNLLHAAASFISHHQKSVGVAGVSDKYGKRSWARYPALWTLRNIDSLPNPDPTDIAALDDKAVDVDKIQIDADAEAKRPEMKRQAQEWAGIKQDPNADLFVFVGRWSKQKGVDLIADVMPSLLDKKPRIQLICVGPVIDLYGRFAAEKLARLMEMYPDRVYSKPEFTALPPYLFSGADFALIPSRDEPFGLVAVEFGRKGALGVGSRLGGLGLMPGWWFPVESPAAQHMLSQLTKTIKLALKSTQEERAILRARSAVQRFPVVEWRQRLEDFQRRSIQTSRSMAGDHAWGYDGVTPPEAPTFNASSASRGDVEASFAALTARSGTPDSIASQDYPSTPGSELPPGAGAASPVPHDYHRRFETPKSQASGDSYFDDAPDGSPSAKSRPKFFSGFDDDHSIMSSDQGDTTTIATGAFADGGAVSGGHAYDNFLAAANRQFAKNQGNRSVPDPFMERRQSSMSMDSNFAPSRPFSINSRVSSFDSISSIVDEKGASSSINKAMESFTDADGEVSQAFVQKLQNLSAANSKGDLCIEKFLIKSEKQFFSEMKREKLTAASVRSRDSFRESMFHSSQGGGPVVVDGFRPESPVYNSMSGHSGEAYSWDHPNGFGHEEETEKPMTRLQIIMDHSIFGWPLYAIVLSLGQLLSATSFQLSLLGGSSTQTAVDMYIICAIFVVASVFWYTFFRMRPSVYVLSLPWVLFAIAFFLVGFPSLHGPFIPPQQWLTKVATWFYAMASAAGFLFFGLNFGEEAGAATEIWIMRACVVQGLQQIWVSALWYWGYTLSGTDPGKYVPSVAIICVVWPLAAISLLFAVLMYWGLPEYYHQIPPYVPNFFKTLVRRKLVIWFLISEILRNYWLSSVYGRNWQFLWQAADVPKWSIVIMIIIFFIGIWGLLLGILIKYSKVHAWLLPVFAVGLGCPRWCQMFWGVSGLGLYVSWGGAAGPYIGTCTWLWLGVLDAIQGVGLGMILLQTLSRLHVCATLAAAQFIGSIVVMIARATAPNKIGPGPVFPNPALYNPETGENNPVAHYEFWICLVCQLIIPFGYFFFFRKEQLTKP